MTIAICRTKAELGSRAASTGAEYIKAAIRERGKARIILGTGNSQVEMLKRLVEVDGIDWSKIEMFHLDEYVGLADTHAASFRRYLKERFVDIVRPGKVWFINADARDLNAEIARLSKGVSSDIIDVAFVGIGENGHIAFNDPPADFKTSVPYLIVDLDLACREQQVGEGWFASVADVPRKAVTMSVRQIMASNAVVCSVPDRRKAQAVRDCLAGQAQVRPEHPASILKAHPEACVFLDPESASLLDGSAAAGG